VASFEGPEDFPAPSQIGRSDDPSSGAGLQRQVVRGGTLAALGMLTSQALSLLTFIVLARLAPPATFGAYAAAALLIQTGDLFAGAGMQAAVIQRHDHVREAASTAFAANIIGGFCLAALAAGCAPLIGLFFHSGEIGRAAAVMAGTIALNALSIVPGALLQRRVSFLYAFVQPSGALVYAAAAIAALAYGLGLWGLVLATYVAVAARTIVVWLLADWRPSLRLVSWQMWRSLAAYGRPLVLSSLLREIGFAGSTAFVGRALGTSDLGRFRSAQRFVMQANTAVVFGSAYVLLPAFARIWQDERRFQEAILRALRTLMLVVFPLSLVFVPLGRPLATILLGDQWSGAGPIMMALAGVGIALALDSVSSEAFKATGRTEILPRMHALTAVVPTALMAALLHFGATGMGLAMSIGMSIVAAYAIRALSRIAHIPLRIILEQIRPAATGAVLMAAGVYLLDRFIVHSRHGHGLLGVALISVDVLGAAILYLGSLSLISRRSIIELKELGRLLFAGAEGPPSTSAR
jgi:O-antigen/teichoic acid export membrane protein